MEMHAGLAGCLSGEDGKEGGGGGGILFQCVCVCGWVGGGGCDADPSERP